MKPIIYFGSNLEQFSDCEITARLFELSVKTHPMMTKRIGRRKNRARHRRLKKCAKLGITTFAKSGFEIYKTAP